MLLLHLLQESAESTPPASQVYMERISLCMDAHSVMPQYIKRVCGINIQIKFSRQSRNILWTEAANLLSN